MKFLPLNDATIVLLHNGIEVGRTVVNFDPRFDTEETREEKIYDAFVSEAWQIGFMFRELYWEMEQ